LSGKNPVAHLTGKNPVAHLTGKNPVAHLTCDGSQQKLQAVKI